MYIYKVTNTINRKTYIGKTTQTVEKRWYQHCKAAEHGKDTALYRAIRKYTPNAFIVEIIEEVSVDLNQRECFWIADLVPEYNMTAGGDGGAIHNQIGKRWKVRDSSRMGKVFKSGRQARIIDYDKMRGGNNYQSTHYIHTPWGVFETWEAALAEAKNIRLTTGRRDVITDKSTLRKYCTDNIHLNKEGRRTFPEWRGKFTRDLGFYLESKHG